MLLRISLWAELAYVVELDVGLQQRFGRFCGLVRITPRPLIPPSSTSCSQHGTILFAALNHLQNKIWRSHLFKALALDAWYTKLKPTKKCARSSELWRQGHQWSNAAVFDEDRGFMDDLSTPSGADPPTAGAALAAAATAALAAGAGGG